MLGRWRLMTVAMIAGFTVASIPLYVPAAAQPATRPTASLLPRQEVEDACKSGVTYLRLALKNGHAEATPQPPPASAAGVPPWGSATIAATLALTYQEDTRTAVSDARNWLRTANVAPELRTAVIHAIRFPPDPLKKQRVTFADEVRRIAIRLAERRGAASDDEVRQIAQVVLAADLLDYKDEPPGPPDRVWFFLLQRLLSIQNASGGWGQSLETNACAISAAWQLITRYRASTDARTLKAAEAAIDRAWSLLTLPDDPPSLYALALAAQSLGRQNIGQQDIFLAGARRLLAIANDDGSFGQSTNRQQRIIDTAAALRFLSLHRVRIGFAVFRPSAMTDDQYARFPVAMEFLCYHVSRDACVATVCWERATGTTKLEDLSAAGVVVLPGSAAHIVTDSEVELLRSYVQRGGLLWCVQDSYATELPARVRAFAGRIFPTLPYRDLPAQHPLFAEAFHRKIGEELPTSVKVSGVSNGTRELLVAVHGTDVVRSWYTGRVGSARWPFKIASELHFTMLLDRFKDRLDRYERPPSAKPSLTTIEVAVCVPGGGDIAEPNAWPRMEQILAADGVRVVVQRAKLTELNPAKHKLCHFTGRGTFTLTADEKHALFNYVKRGGTVLIDPNNADADFNKSVRNQLLTALGQPPDEELPTTADDDPVAPAIQGQRSSAGFRSMMRSQGDLPRGLGLRQLTIDGRRAVIVAEFDLSAAMAGVDYRHIRGYNVETGTQIVRLLLLALK